ncbi:MAG TPA: DUF4983 domain-containing protein [Niabella sp.]|nr:DUF4983 domain-containing protein [Niabella sp.]HQX20871.1 DUF4983 domain-containing protein [Niabella sp.]HQX41561.1 DUF4983 domain-containing protein [Niabella sp.]HRB08351.1 DUF4983 domain-containing protein [Niabella sp.]HRB48560.1 DUF4983 domain-containing protein [Niabella sp.]
MIHCLRRVKQIFYFLAVVSTVAVVLPACNKTLDNKLESPDNEANPKAKARKVLMLIVDGGYGTEIKKIAPPNMNDLSGNSIFSWDALNSVSNTIDVTDQQGWATLLTGVAPEKHGVISEVSTNNFTQYPTIFSRLKTASAALRTVAIGSSSALTGTIAAAASEKKLVANDAAVKDAILAELNTGNPDFLVAQFSGVETAGQEGGYLASSEAYKTAVLTIDTYVGAIANALNARANAPNEDWMLLITSAKGNNTAYVPTTKPWSAFDDGRHNNFIIMANPRFAYNNEEKPSVFPYYGTTNSYRIGNVTGTSRRSAQVKDATKYNFGSSGDFSVQCKVKIPAGSYGYPSFLGKRNSFNQGAGDAGWLFFLEGADWQINSNGGGGSGATNNKQARGTKVSDNLWHTLTAVIRQNGASSRISTVFTDGIKNNSVDLATRNLNTTSPFSIGWRDGSNGGDIQLNVTDVRIYNRALTDLEISNNFCRTDADLTDPSLLGFWPSTTIEYDNVGKPFFRDYTSSANHLFLNNPSIIAFSEASFNVCPPVDEVAYKTVPQSVDVATQIYLWMGYAIPQTWGLEGQSWIPKYIDVVE